MFDHELTAGEGMILEVFASFNRKAGEILLWSALEGRYQKRGGASREFGPAMTSLMALGFIERDLRVMAFRLTNAGYDVALGIHGDT